MSGEETHSAFNRETFDEFIINHIYNMEGIRTFLNSYAGKLPSFNKYLSSLRYDIHNKSMNRPSHSFDEQDYLIMDGLYEDEYKLCKLIIKAFKTIDDGDVLRNRLKQIGETLYGYRQRKSLIITHYSFHAYINILLKTHADKFTEQEVRELYASSLILEHMFSGIGDWLM